VLDAEPSARELVAVVEPMVRLRLGAVEVLVEEACEESMAALKDAKLVSVKEVVAVLVPL